MITVVGIGPGDVDYLTPAARRAIERAEVLVGGKRHLATLSCDSKESRLLDADLLGLLAWLDSHKHRAIVVLASEILCCMASANCWQQTSALRSCISFPALARFNICAPKLHWI